MVVLGLDYYAGIMAAIVDFIYYLVKGMILFDRGKCIDIPCG